MTTPARRCFRVAFSLRTLFIVVTLVGVWLGWQLSIVRDRKAILAELQSASGGDFAVNYVKFDESDQQFKKRSRYYGVPSVRRLLGDQGCFQLAMPHTCSPELIARAEYAFPEANLCVYTSYNILAKRDSLLVRKRYANSGTIFKTGLIEK